MLDEHWLCIRFSFFVTARIIVDAIVELDKVKIVFGLI